MRHQELICEISTSSNWRDKTNSGYTKIKSREKKKKNWPCFQHKNHQQDPAEEEVAAAEDRRILPATQHQKIDFKSTARTNTSKHKHHEHSGMQKERERKKKQRNTDQKLGNLNAKSYTQNKTWKGSAFRLVIVVSSNQSTISIIKSLQQRLIIIIKMQLKHPQINQKTESRFSTECVSFRETKRIMQDYSNYSKPQPTRKTIPREMEFEKSKRERERISFKEA